LTIASAPPASMMACLYLMREAVREQSLAQSSTQSVAIRVHLCSPIATCPRASHPNLEASHEARSAEVGTNSPPDATSSPEAPRWAPIATMIACAAPESNASRRALADCGSNVTNRPRHASASVTSARPNSCKRVATSIRVPDEGSNQHAISMHSACTLQEGRDFDQSTWSGGRPSIAIRRHQSSSIAISRHQSQTAAAPIAISLNQPQSAAISRNRSQSDAINVHRTYPSRSRAA
jgi:hypothetical protein